MSLLIEPANQAACKRNEKERLLMQGRLKKKSQEDYILAHMGLTKTQLQFTGAPQTSLVKAGSSGSLKAAGSRASLTENSLKDHTAAMEGSSRARGGSASGLGRTSGPGSMAGTEVSAPEQAPPPQDPVLAVMMNGPPLFSPGLCSKVATSLFG
eukprot:TRINITY_DN19025_c3_g1_i1.p1 TRINITY_DN19025_c3_g1~~TRINITY_DN19025_c3_g1_i1.p1  ORF type:complete len:154 (+),score=33.77 TRINITY_DN19025_c3_g1_i1:74-535(+)